MIKAKYFIAIVLPEPQLAIVEAIKEHLLEQYGLKGALRSPAHITLHRPFEWKEEREGQLIEKLSEFKFLEQIPIRLYNFGFFEPRVIFIDVLANPSLNLLHHQLLRFSKNELRLFNEAEDLRGFYPHVTIAFRDLKKPVFYQLQQKYSELKFDQSFQCKAFSLLKLDKKWEVLQNFNI